MQPKNRKTSPQQQEQRFLPRNTSPQQQKQRKALLDLTAAQLVKTQNVSQKDIFGCHLAEKCQILLYQEIHCD